MSRFEEKTLHSKTIFEGRVIRVQLDTVELPNGNTSTRELVMHSGAVAVMAINSENRMVFVRQYRKPLEREILEIPAGKLEPGEDPDDCARREMEEETGYQAATLKKVSSFYTSPGFADEILYLYEGTGLTEGEARPDEDEFVERVELTLEEAFWAMEAGEICDAKTVAALYWWKSKVLEGK
ncbi:ADP-ribose pyrophosphatase [Marininema mesophilum]|uniref:ADP-ribose pyrophosphatase n=1 Tax=Marininema mesophilum TaxID=1048340 RepID=A0A1H2UGS0_9BACL|nr:NUDIX hydrolase [Marininema mesophilum]SDW55312.1 ADP-ribose pyrophosphatase [Marininema mesophilum]